MNIHDDLGPVPEPYSDWFDFIDDNDMDYDWGEDLEVDIESDDVIK